MSDDPPPSSRRGIFSTDASRANQILARTLYNELVSSGRDRSAIVDIVNALLDVLFRSQGKPSPATLVDPETGFPTRAGLLALLQHELDPSLGEQQRRATLALFSAPGGPSTPVLAGLVRSRLRGGDFVVPLGDGRAAAILYCDDTHARAATERLAKAIGDHSALGAAPVAHHIEPLKRGDRVVAVWKRALIGLRAARAAAPGVTG